VVGARGELSDVRNEHVFDHLKIKADEERELG
jgi:hypothetical protein